MQFSSNPISRLRSRLGIVIASLLTAYVIVAVNVPVQAQNPQWATGFQATTGFADAPLLVDGNKNDFATYYEVVNPSVGVAAITARYDLGTAPVGMTKWDYSFYKGAAQIRTAADYSNDGLNWTQFHSYSSDTTYRGGVQSGGTYRNAITARYWRVSVRTTGLASGEFTRLSDFRLFDSAGNLIGGVSTNLIATAIAYSQVNLTWSDNSTSETCWIIERKIGANGVWSQIGSTDANVTQFQDTLGLNPSVQYVYRVRAMTLDVPLNYTNEAQATTPAYSGSGGTPYLADLTVYPAGIAESQTATGTLTLSAPAATPTVVTLARSDATAITMPSSVTIPTGATSAQFTMSGVSGKGSADGTPLTISGKVGVWMQAAYLTEVSTPSAVAVSNMKAIPGNNCVVVRWEELPEKAVRSVLIYRRLGAGAFQLVASLPSSATLYADNSVQNGTAYEYQTAILRWDGTNSAANPVGVTPAQSAPQIAWVQTPSVDNAGLLTLSISADTSDSLFYRVIVDGYDVGTLGDGDSGCTDSKAVIDTSSWPNGTHTVQVASRRLPDGSAAATAPFTIVTNNSVSERWTPVLVNRLRNDVLVYKARTQAATSDVWTVNLSRRDQVTGTMTQVRSWQGQGQNVSVAWDGKDANGNNVADGPFETQLIWTLPPSPVDQIYVAGGYPVALALLSRIGPDRGMITRPDDKVEGTNDIALAKAKIFERAYAINGKPVASLIKVKGALPIMRGTKFLLRDVRDWMRNSVRDIYVYGHAHYGGFEPPYQGVTWRRPPSIFWGDVTIAPDHMTPSKNPQGVIIDFDNPLIIFVADEVRRRGNIYYFAWLDGCDTLGGVAANVLRNTGETCTLQNTRKPLDNSINSDWETAFNVDPFGGVMGGNGEILLGASTLVKNNTKTGTIPTGAFFYQFFWQKVESGVVTISDCYSYAVTKTINHLNAHPDYKITTGDWFYPWYNPGGNNLRNRVTFKGIGYLPYGGQ